MAKWKIIAASMALSIPFTISSGMAQQFVCDPHCSPSYEDHHRGEGLQNANSKAGDHGFEGRDNARQKQDARRHGGSGVPDPTPVPVPIPTLDPTSTSTGDTSSVPTPTPTFPSGCSLC